MSFLAAAAMVAAPLVSKIAGKVVDKVSGDDKKAEKSEAQTTQNSGINSLVNPQTLQLAMSLIGQSGSANNAVDVIKNIGLDSFEANASSTATA